MTARVTSTGAKFLTFVVVLGEDGGLPEGFLGFPEGSRRVFHGLPGMLVSGKVIFLPVIRCGCAMRVRGLFVKFRCSNVRVSRHESP